MPQSSPPSCTDYVPPGTSQVQGVSHEIDMLGEFLGDC